MRVWGLKRPQKTGNVSIFWDRSKVNYGWIPVYFSTLSLHHVCSTFSKYLHEDIKADMWHTVNFFRSVGYLRLNLSLFSRYYSIAYWSTFSWYWHTIYYATLFLEFCDLSKFTKLNSATLRPKKKYRKTRNICMQEISANIGQFANISCRGFFDMGPLLQHINNCLLSYYWDLIFTSITPLMAIIAHEIFLQRN